VSDARLRQKSVLLKERETEEATSTAEVSEKEGAPPPEHPGPRGAEHWSRKEVAMSRKQANAKAVES